MEDYIVSRRSAPKASLAGDPLRHDAVRAVCAAETNVFLPPRAADGVAMRAGDRVLLIEQPNPENNGLWVHGPRLARPPDFLPGAAVPAGAAVHVAEGLMFGGQRFRLAADAVVGSGPQTWVSCGVTDARLDALPPRAVLKTDARGSLAAAVGLPGQVLMATADGIEFGDMPMPPMPPMPPAPAPAPPTPTPPPAPARAVAKTDAAGAPGYAGGRPGQVLQIAADGSDIVFDDPPARSVSPPLSVRKTDIDGLPGHVSGRAGQVLRIAADGSDIVFDDLPPPLPPMPPMTIIKTGRSGVAAAVGGKPGQTLQISADGSDIVFADAPPSPVVFAAVAASLLGRAGETAAVSSAVPDVRVRWSSPDLMCGAACDGTSVTLTAAGVYEISLTGTFSAGGIASTSSFLEAQVTLPGGHLVRRFSVSAFHRATGTSFATCSGSFPVVAAAPRCEVRVFAYRSEIGNDLTFSPANTSMLIRLLRKQN